MTMALKNVLAGFFVMLCLGSVYAWSVFVPSLKNVYNLSTTETQAIFGVLIAVFTTSMTLSRGLLQKYGPRILGTVSGSLFLIGYGSTILSNGSFPFLLFAIGVVAGISTGLGYLVSISVPVQYFPQKKGLVTGVCAAGFGAGAIVVSYVATFLLQQNFSVLQVFATIGGVYGILIILFAQWFKKPEMVSSTTQTIPIRTLLQNKTFYRLIVGIFAGTFSGLLVIGNLKPIGLQHSIDIDTLVHGVALFSIANFLGRVGWGWLSDRVSGKLLIPTSLLFIGTGTLILCVTPLTAFFYLALAMWIGFSFGANFVLYAKETAQVYGVENVSTVYPFIFLGYGISGITGPIAGSILHDLSGSYESSGLIAFALSVLATVTFLLLTIERQSTRTSTTGGSRLVNV